MLDTLLKEAVLLIALISGIPLLISSTTGLVLSVFQASTQIQEQTVQFILKLLSVSIAFYAFGGVFLDRLTWFIQECLREIPRLGASS